MTREDLRRRDLVRLTKVHPALSARVLKVLAAMEALGFPMTITAGVRTVEEQFALYQKGRTQDATGQWVAIGDTVTNADGTVKKSNHQVKDDGYGHAVDCVFLTEDLQPTWDAHYPWVAYGACAKAVGLVWGGDWIHLVDRPHLELPVTIPV